MRRRTPVQADQNNVQGSRGVSITTSEVYMPWTVERTSTLAALAAERTSPCISPASVAINIGRPSPGLITLGSAASVTTPGRALMPDTEIMPAFQYQAKVSAPKKAVGRNQQSPVAMVDKGKGSIIIIDDHVVAQTNPGQKKSTSGKSVAFRPHRGSDRLSQHRLTANAEDGDSFSRLTIGGRAIVLNDSPQRFDGDQSKEHEQQQSKAVDEDNTEGRADILKHMAMALALRDDGWADDGKLILLRALKLF
ncbi:hypothetical protein BDV97DRAFT_369926 [Delphinella strobiligena]|nr:hypothetical protein BDV97DRAFT_369926 [Delphinella strobiligena]